MVQKILNSHKSVIFLNGDLPDVKEYYPYINDKIIITADGATTTLINNHIKVDYAIGDLDSIFSTKNSLIGQIIKIDDQTNTDFEKCMDFVLTNKLYPTLVFGISGGEIDHTINNIFSLSNHLLHNIFFLDIKKYGKKFGNLIINSDLILTLPIGSKVSLIPYPTALVTTNGLNWELDRQHLNNSNFISARNHNISEKLYIKAEQGKLLVITDYKGVKNYNA